ncbi:unnamed protein product [Eruca vesicaria subsp. sativa]|uniref:DDRGK domain-containing protein 1 n=1 Tax=Eruca vesicaria subsp. sativa TaxID=29727 RepID=A0ABC8JF49_ERUVS|nr:unnamed protein product [Eruca vesicaria subsp. sativa]
MILIAAVIPLFLWKRRVDARSREQVDAQPPLAQARENVVRATGGGGGRRMRRRPAASGLLLVLAPPQHLTFKKTLVGVKMKTKMKLLEIKPEHQRRRRGSVKNEKNKDRLKKLHASQGVQNKIGMQRCVGRRMRSVRQRSGSWWEEEEKARQAKEEEAAALEFDKWKGEFSVDAEGTTEEVQGGNQDLLSEFVEYIKKQKCVPLEDLAAEFNLRTQECINRIASLEIIGRLSGVMDDRGKYIYISMEEMNAVADYIKRQGRVSISHLASKSNQFIDLEPKVQDQLTEEISGMEEISVS